MLSKFVLQEDIVDKDTWILLTENHKLLMF